MKNIKIHVPKIRLTIILGTILAFAVLLEAAVLVKFLAYGLPRQTETLAPLASDTVVRINRSGMQKAQEWFAERENYTIPSYVIRDIETGLGRENPFLEYK